MLLIFMSNLLLYNISQLFTHSMHDVIFILNIYLIYFIILMLFILMLFILIFCYSYSCCYYCYKFFMCYGHNSKQRLLAVISQIKTLNLKPAYLPKTAAVKTNAHF